MNRVREDMSLFFVLNERAVKYTYFICGKRRNIHDNLISNFTQFGYKFSQKINIPYFCI